MAEGNVTQNPTNNLETSPVESLESGSEVKVVQTDTGAKDGQNKCPKCGSTEISLNIETGKLRCHFCRHEFEPEKVEGLETDIGELKGEILASGARDISADSLDMITLKCTGCGAEVVIDTAYSTQARCHWCRSTLSINQQIPNGSIPDVVLPFALKKDDAKAEIQKFVKKRKMFAHPTFKKEFTTDNIMGVYFPYMVVDVNAHANLIGEGEHLVNAYTRGSDDNPKRYYDADLYHVEREFDVEIHGLTIESSSDKLNKTATDKTTNVINSIMPFDIENSVKWDSNYLKGYSSERRDVNVDALRGIVDMQSKDITKFSVNNTLEHYDRGVAWRTQDLDVKGQQWKAAYLPVWLYSYQQVKGERKTLHYVAVNARTKETMGSVPIHMPLLIIVSCIVEVFGIIAALTVDFDHSWLFLLVGFIYFFIIYLRYRNSNARHRHETETKTEVSNLRKVDKLIQRRSGLRNSRMEGANNTTVLSQGFSGNFLDFVATGNIAEMDFNTDKTIEKNKEEKL